MKFCHPFPKFELSNTPSHSSVASSLRGLQRLDFRRRLSRLSTSNFINKIFGSALGFLHRGGQIFYMANVHANHRRGQKYLVDRECENSKLVYRTDNVSTQLNRAALHSHGLSRVPSSGGAKGPTAHTMAGDAVAYPI